MKVSKFLVFAAAAISSASLAYGFAQFARGELVLSTTALARYDSRVFGGTNPADDYIFTLDPRLIYRREAGQLKLSSTLGTRINRYVDHDELDSEDFVASVRLSLPPESSALWSGSFETSYDEHTDVNYDVNTHVREKIFMSRFNTNIPTSLKTSVVLGGSFRRDQRNRFSDREMWDGLAGFRYGDFLHGAAFEATYRYLELESNGGNIWGIPLRQFSDIYSATFSRPIYGDIRGSVSYGYRVLRRSSAEVFPAARRSAGSIFSVRLDGPFLPESRFPKVETSLTLGYQKAETPGINDTGGSRFVGSMHISWQARERTRLSFDARRALELSINDLTVETTAFSVGVNQSIGDFTTGSFSAGYEQRDYRTVGRSDDVLTAAAALGYKITRAWSAHAAYRVRAADSDARIADYARHTVILSVNYTF